MLGINMIIITILSTCFHCDIITMNTISPTLQDTSIINTIINSITITISPTLQDT